MTGVFVRQAGHRQAGSAGGQGSDNTRNRGVRRLWCGALAGVLASVLAACGGHGDEAAAPRTVMTVELVSPQAANWSDALVASGEIAPWQEASVGAEVSGVRLEAVLVDVGSVVKKGQLLARYDEDTLRVDLRQLDAAVAEARANLTRAEADAKRAEEMQKIGALSEQGLLLQRTQAEVAAAQLASAEARRDAQALRLRHARVVAPDDGVISARFATVGAVGMMGAELFRLVRRNRLEWRAEVPAEAFAQLRPGLAATVETIDGRRVDGKVRQLAPTVDSGTRNGLVYVDLPIGCGLSAGMYVSGRFALAPRPAQIVPDSAIVLRDGNRYLMEVDAERHVHAVKVETGRRQDDAIEIVGGIDPARRFIKSGGAFVAEGDLVRIADAVAATP